MKKVRKFRGGLPKRVREIAELMSLRCEAPDQHLNPPYYGGMHFEAPAHQRMLQRLKRMGLSPDGKGNLFFNVSAPTKAADTYLKIHIAKRMSIELFTATSHLLTPQTEEEKKILKVLRTLKPVLSKSADEWASWILEKRL